MTELRKGLLRDRDTFASWRFLSDKTDDPFTEFQEQIKGTFDLALDRDYASVGHSLLTMWRDVQNLQQDLYGSSTFVTWDRDIVSNNSASMRIMDLEKLGLGLMRDAAIAFHLARGRSFEREHIEADPLSSSWPKLGSTLQINGKPIKAGTGIECAINGLKYPLDALLENCTEYQAVAQMLCYYYFMRSPADHKGLYSADLECLIAHRSGLTPGVKTQFLEHALERVSKNSDMGHKSWIETCVMAHSRQQKFQKRITSS